MSAYTRDELTGMFEATSQLMDQVQIYANARSQTERDFSADFHLGGVDEDGLDIWHYVPDGCGGFDRHTLRITLDELQDTDFQQLKAEVEARDAALEAAQKADLEGHRSRRAAVLEAIKEKEKRRVFYKDLAEYTSY